MKLTVEQIAKVCHEVNKAFCASIGDNSQLEWDEAPDWVKVSAIKGVEYHIAKPDANPSDSHDAWLAEKIITGWKYGPVKDADKKEHPCFVPYNELPVEQQSKDYIFKQVVHSLINIE